MGRGIVGQVRPARSLLLEAPAGLWHNKIVTQTEIAGIILICAFFPSVSVSHVLVAV